MMTFLLPDPSILFKPVGSFGLAAITGATYGYIARSISPQAGIIPAHYALWFIVAYRIKEKLDDWESELNIYLGDTPPAQTWAEAANETREVKIKIISWKAIEIKNEILKATDLALCYLFGLRPYKDVTAANVNEASFLEMCRYRAWNVFRITIKDHISIVAAHHMTHLAGFHLPIQTRVPFFITIEILVQNILLVPLAYKYINMCDHLAAQLDNEAATALARRAQWIRGWLPAL